MTCPISLGPARRQFYDEPRALGLIILDPDASPVFGDYVSHDGQAEPRASISRRKLRQEELVSITRINAVSGIGDCQPHRIGLAVET